MSIEERIIKKTAYDRLIENKDFKIFMDDVAGLEKASYQNWKTIPAENTADIIKYQVLGKVPDVVRTILATGIEDGKLAELEAKENSE